MRLHKAAVTSREHHPEEPVDPLTRLKNGISGLSDDNLKKFSYDLQQIDAREHEGFVACLIQMKKDIPDLTIEDLISDQ